MFKEIRKLIAAGLCAACAAAPLARPIYALAAGVVAEGSSEEASGTEEKNSLAPLALEARDVSYDSVTISWGAAENAAEYELQQSEDKENYTPVATVPAGGGLSASVADLYTGRTYYFRVVMTDGEGKATSGKALKVKPTLAAPSFKKLSPSASDRVDISWSQTDGADFYRVYRSASKSGGYKSVKTVYGTSYTDKVAGGRTYYYKIMPLRYNPDGKKTRGKCSAVKSVKVIIGTPSIASVDSIADENGDSLIVSWNPVQDAERYKVYRSTSRTSGYKCVAKLDGAVLSWTDTDVKPGKKYYYKVSAGTTASGKMAYGSKSVSASRWTVSKAPKDISISQDGAGGVTLQWSPSEAADYYQVYRAMADGDYVLLKDRVGSCSYTDVGLSDGETYSYRVSAVHGTLESPPGPEAAVKVGAIRVNTRTLFMGAGMTAVLTAETELDGTLSWTSEDDGVANVSDDGTVTAIAPGKTHIRAEVGGVSTNVEVNVTDCALNGIDVSKWQQDIDWARVRESGIDFAMLRLAHGAAKDVKFEDNYEGAVSEGIAVGVYCYSCAKTVKDGIKEAEDLIAALDGRELAYPVALDLEDDLQLKNMNTSERTDMILEYKRIVEEAGYDFVVYANINWLTNYIDRARMEEEGVDIWIARYRKQSLGYGYEGGGNVRIWQYSNTGQVDGIMDSNGRYIDVDLDVCYDGY